MVGVPDVSVVGVDVEVGGEGLGSSSPRFMPLRGVQSLVLFSSGYGTGENRQLGFGEISIFILINNGSVGGGGKCLLVLHLQWYIWPLLVIRQGLNRALLAFEVAPEEVRKTAKPATTQYSLPLTASASSRRKTNICVRNFLLVVIWAQHRSLVLSKFSTILRF